MDEKDYLKERNYAPLHLGRVLVLGMGESGQAAIRYLAPLVGTRVSHLHGVDSRSIEEVQRRVGFCAVDPHVTTDFECESVSGEFDLCIVTPGLAPHTALYKSAEAASVEMIGEVEFAWRESLKASHWVAVTGTNGKTTVTALTAHILNEAGISASAVGNIGDTCIDAVAAGGKDVWVAEVSSFQLAATARFAPEVAILLNITPDHLSWHGSFAAYVQAKHNILANLASVPDAWAVLNAGDDEVRAIIRELRPQSASERGFSYVPVGTAQGVSGDMRIACGAENAAFVDEKARLRIVLGGNDAILCATDELPFCGDHNLVNALSAACAAAVLGVEPHVISAALASFQPLPHRIEFCGSIDGIRCFNDSKATNVDATRKALTAFSPRRAIFLLGGDDKGTDLSDLVKALDSHAKAVVCFGEARARFMRAFATDEAGIPVLCAQRMEDAFKEALTQAAEGDSIVLSPACASFDEFSSFEERGDIFKALVKAHPGFSKEAR